MNAHQATVTRLPAELRLTADIIAPASADFGCQWQSRQLVVTPELLGLRNTAECQERAAKLGLTPLPHIPHRQEYWRLDVLLAWSRANGLDRLPALGKLSAHRRMESPSRLHGR